MEKNMRMDDMISTTPNEKRRHFKDLWMVGWRPSGIFFNIFYLLIYLPIAIFLEGKILVYFSFNNLIVFPWNAPRD